MDAEKDGPQYKTPENIFNLFCEAEEFPEILHWHKSLCRSLNITSVEGLAFYKTIKSSLTSWKCQALWDLLDARANQSVYGQGKFCEDVRVFVIGSGPIGLRTAIECAFLGCKVVVVEKRTTFSRNNVLHLWSFLLQDFRALGAKKFYGKFGAGSIDHISIRVLQAVLLKTALLLGVQVFSGITFLELVEPTTTDEGWKAKCSPDSHPVNKWKFNVIIGADGKKNVLPGFQQIELRGKVAIGITCNFVNYNTLEEANVQEISGIAYQFKPEFFDSLNAKQGVRLENIVYYKDATHYFVMTAIKSSLLQRGVLKQDYSDPSKLLDRSNIDQDELVSYTCDAVNFATDYQLPKLDLVELANGGPDIALFDFTSIKKASNACRIVERKGQRLLLALVGDSLLEPFWPTGSGCARGVLSAQDTGWMIRQYGKGYPPLYIIRDRENIFKLLSGTSNDNLQKNINSYTIDPKTRYSNVSSKKMLTAHQLRAYYDTDDPENADYSLAIPDEKGAFEIGVHYPVNKTKSNRRKSGNRRRSSVSGRNRRKSERGEGKNANHVSKDTTSWESKVPNSKLRPAKRSRPSESRSGSVSSGLHSISESDQEGPPGSVSSATYSRQNSRTTQASMDSGGSSRRGTRASQSELDDVFLSSSPGKEASLTNFYMSQRNKEGHSIAGEEKTSKSWFRRKISHNKSSEDTERKLTAARKSIGNAKKYRLRRLSREHGANQTSRNKENKGMGSEMNRQGNKVHELKQVLVTERSQDSTSKAVLENKLSGGSIQNGKLVVKSGERYTVTKSCKELIAEAEAREKSKKEKMKGFNDLDERRVPRAMKRKANEPASANKRKSLNRELGSLVGNIMTVDSDIKVDETASTQKLLELAICRAAGIVLAVPLLLNCDQGPDVRLNGASLPPEEKQEAASKSSSNGKKEIDQLHFQRAGSVQKRRQEYLQMIARKESEKKSYYEFKQQTRVEPTDRDQTDNAETSSLISNSSRTSSLVGQTDFVPKDVIDADTCLMEDGEQGRGHKSPRHQRRVAKSPKDPLKCRDEPTSILLRLKQELTPKSLNTTLNILLAMHRRIQHNPDVDKYFRVHVMGDMIQKYVWNVHAARDFLDVIGWKRVGSFVLLSKSTLVNKAIASLEDSLRSLQASGAIFKQESVTYKRKQPDSTDPRRIRKWDSVPSSAARPWRSKSVEELHSLIDDLEETLIDNEESDISRKSSKDTSIQVSERNADDDYLVLSYDARDLPNSFEEVKPMVPNEESFHEERGSVDLENGNVIVDQTENGKEWFESKAEESEEETSSKIEVERKTSTNIVIDGESPMIVSSKHVEDSAVMRKDPTWRQIDDDTAAQINEKSNDTEKPLNHDSLDSDLQTLRHNEEVHEKPEPLEKSENPKRKISRPKLSLSKVTKEQSWSMNSPTSESDDPLSPGASGHQKKKKKKRKRFLKIVRKFKRSNSKSAEEESSLAPPENSGLPLSSSWADITENGYPGIGKTDVIEAESYDRMMKKDQGKAELTDDTEDDQFNSGDNDLDMSPQRVVVNIPRTDSGLYSGDEVDSVKEEGDHEPKSPKKKNRFLKIRRKKGSRDSGSVSDMSATEVHESTPSISHDIAVKESGRKFKWNESSKKTKKPTSPPSRRFGKLKNISTNPVDI